MRRDELVAAFRRAEATIGGLAEGVDFGAVSVNFVIHGGRVAKLDYSVSTKILGEGNARE